LRAGGCRENGCCGALGSYLPSAAACFILPTALGAKGVLDIGQGPKTRFTLDKGEAEAWVAPGCYEIPSTLRVPKPSRRGVMVSTEARFFRGATDPGGDPTPAATVGHGTLFRPTFNIIVAEQSALQHHW